MQEKVKMPEETSLCEKDSLKPIEPPQYNNYYKEAPGLPTIDSVFQNVECLKNEKTQFDKWDPYGDVVYDGYYEYKFEDPYVTQDAFFQYFLILFEVQNFCHFLAF